MAPITITAAEYLKHPSRGLERFKKGHYDLICEWYEERDKNPPRRETLSDMGYIADGRVAGWLYLTNSNIAFIEGIVSDPATVPSLRRQSLRKLCGFLVDTALMLGYTNIIGISGHPSIDKVAKELGFKAGKTNIYTLSEKDEE